MRVWLFDIDGTLIASRGAGQAATFSAIGNAFAKPVSAEGVLFAGRTDRAIAADVFRLHGIPNTEENWKTFQIAYLDHLDTHLRQRQGEVLASVHDLVDRLRQVDNLHLGLLTGNVRAGAERKLRHYDLWHHFHFGGFGDHHESRDDVARQAFEDACRFLNADLDPQDIWIIGDTIHDITCARAIGAKVVAVATGGTDLETLAAAGPDVLVRDLTDSETLDQILG